MKKNVAVFIGRFQPFHLGHQHVVEQALKNYNHVIFLLGSAEQARTPKNPFTFEERKKMIENSLSNNDDVKISILPLHDYIYDNQKWIAEVQNQINSVTEQGDFITLIGNIKDKSSEYLKYFPHFNKDFSAGLTKDKLSATTLRQYLFNLNEEIDKLK